MTNEAPQDKAKLRRALRTAVDIAASAPVIAEALANHRDEPQRKIAATCRSAVTAIGAIRSALVAIDADETACQECLGTLQPQSGTSFAAVEDLWRLMGVASRRVHAEHLAPVSAAPRKPAPIAPEAKAANKRLVLLEAFAGRSHLHGRPWRHLLDPSSVCNLRCKTCYQSNSQAFLYHDIASADTRALVSAMPYAEYANIGGTGEPLLSPSAADLARSYSEVGAHVEITTNGTLPERLAAIAPFANTINISMDGGVKETFEAIRAGANFGKVTTAIRALAPELRAKVRSIA